MSNSSKDKLKVWIDVDSVVYESVMRMCDMYTRYYSGHPRYVEPNHEKMSKWNGEDELPLLKKGDIELIFSEPDFYIDSLIKKDCIEVLERLSHMKEIELGFCSIGTSENIKYKIDFLKRNFPFIKQSIFITYDGGSAKLDKSVLKGDFVLLDDNVKNLKSSEVFLPVVFMDHGNKEWNKGYENITCGKVTSWLGFEYFMDRTIYRLLLLKSAIWDKGSD